ncbi:LysR family transcriptional regulator [Microbacterium sp. HD4P20]|uniref:LysR family transcriptional regulator n=1 Tax=Microbacterium sp. HD4P20 TaxID=2864874 RepID=UPI0020A45E0F|nr:LysR family transcriptional regulator [Microbacterium sp. HD4P20]MCP2636539.1 LysR family transcriptional regulator [Microbacterium sp. HD4P20]
MISDAFSTFLSIHEAGTIGGAAAALHVSQPAVSRRLQTLEAEVGAPLFERTRHGLRLTSAGEVLLPHAERIRAAHRDAARALADHLGEPGGAVRLSIVGSLAGRWFSAALANVRTAHPAVELIVSTGTSRQVNAQVARGDAVAGVSYARPVDDDLRSRPLFDERLVLVCHPSHRLAGERVTGLEQLGGELWLLFPERADQSESSDAAARRLLRRHAVPEDRIRPIDSLSAQRALAAAGYGLAFLPPEAAADAVEAGHLRTIAWVGEPVGTAVHLVTRRSGYLGPAAQAAIESLTRTPPAE